MSTRTDHAFLSASAAAVVLGVAVAAVTPLAAGADAAFRGSIVTSAVLGLVFGGQHLRRFRRDGRPHLPGAVVSTVFGGWFMAAPLLYDVGFLATAGVQFAGLVVAAFGGYLTVHALSDGRPATA